MTAKKKTGPAEEPAVRTVKPSALAELEAAHREHREQAEADHQAGLETMPADGAHWPHGRPVHPVHHVHDAAGHAGLSAGASN